MSKQDKNEHGNKLPKSVKSDTTPAQQQGQDNASGTDQRNKNGTINNTSREGGSTGTA